MKYWILTTEYPPFYGGGISTYCAHTAHMLTERGHQVTVFVPDESIPERLIVSEINGVRVVRFKPGQSKAYQYLGYVAALSYQFSEIVEEFVQLDGPPDIIESQDYLGISYFLLQKKFTLHKKLENLTIVLTLHTPKFICDLYDQAPVYRFPNFWIGEMERFCIKAADCVISPSHYLLEEMRRHLDLSGIKSFVVRNPFDSNTVKGGLNGNPEDVIFFGRLQYMKGILHLLEYLRELWEEGVELPLKVIGGDTYFHPKKQMMSQYLLKRYGKYFERGLITLIGRVPPEKLTEIFDKTRVAVVPSVFENFPYAVVELMSYGVITLASDSGGQREIIENGKSGFLFSHNKKHDFKAKLMTIIELKADQRAVISENARRRIQELCSYERVYEEKMHVLEQVVRTKARSRLFPFVRIGYSAPKNAENDRKYKEEKDLLSVIVPYYNMGKYILETVESLMQITYPKKEILIINDGSDDPQSIAVLYEIEKSYPIQVIHKHNEGLARTRNRGAQLARGEFLAFLDADDKVEPEFYEWAIRILKSYDNVSFVGCWTEYFDGGQGIWPTWNPEPPYLLVHNTLNTSGLVFRRQDFLLYGLNDPQMEYGLEDYETVIKMVENGCGGVAIPFPLFKYRIRPDSMFRQINRDNMLYLYGLIAKKHTKLYERYAVDVFNILNANGPGYLYDNPTWELPAIGFVVADRQNLEKTASDWSLYEWPPEELKRKLLVLWSKPMFRKFVKLFFRFRLDRLFTIGSSRK